MVTALAILVAVAVVFVPGTITVLKGQLAVFFAGFLVLGLVWVVAAFRLAQPDSWWARRFYDDRKMSRARGRYGE